MAILQKWEALSPESCRRPLPAQWPNPMQREIRSPSLFDQNALKDFLEWETWVYKYKYLHLDDILKEWIDIGPSTWIGYFELQNLPIREKCFPSVTIYGIYIAFI